MTLLLQQHRTFAVLLATIVLMELAHGIEIVTLLPLYLTKHFSESGAFVGLVASAYLLVDTLLTRTPAGLLADRFGRKPILTLGIILSVFPLPFMVTAGSSSIFVPLNIVNGLGAGMIWPCIYAFVADLYPREQRGTVLGVINMVMLGGLAAGGPISGSLLLGLLGYPDASAFPLGFAACIAIVLLALLLVLIFAQEVPRSEIVESTDRGMLLDQNESGQTATSLRQNFSLLLLIGLAITLALGLIVPILTLFGTDILHVSLETFGFIMIPPALTAALLLVPAGRRADRHGRHGQMVLGLALIAIPFLAAAISINPLIVCVGGIVAALGYAAFVPAWNALIMDWIPSQRRGLFLGGVATVQGLGLAAGPFLGGLLFQLSPYAPFWTAGVILAVAALIGVVVERQSRTPSLVKLTDRARNVGGSL